MSVESRPSTEKPARPRSVPRRFGPGSSGIIMTPEEFDAIARSRVDDRYRYELIRGVLVVSPLAGRAELSPNDLLGYLLHDYQQNHPRGSVLYDTWQECELVLGETRRRCDRAIWIGWDHAPEETALPEIAVEFVSPRKRDAVRDYATKRQEYLAAGIREYWIIDRFQRNMTIHKPGAEGFTTTVVPEAQTYQTDLLPGFVLPLARILERADRYPKKPRKRRTPRKPPAAGAE